MDDTPLNYQVIFKADAEIIFATSGSIAEQKGEPHDTAQIYIQAFKNLIEAVRNKTVSREDFEKGNITEIISPDGQSKLYTDDEMEKLLDEYSELIKYRATKNSKVIVTVEGGFTGGVMGTTNVTLDKLNDEDFNRVLEITDLLQTRSAKLEYAQWGGDFGYFVRVGDNDTTARNMKVIFEGGSFSKTPLVVEELQEILKKYVEKNRDGFFRL